MPDAAPVEPIVEPIVAAPVEPIVEPIVAAPVEPIVAAPVEPIAEPIVEKSVHVKKTEIKNDVTKLTYEDRLYVLEILKQQLPSNKIIENADGCRINLDTLSDDIIHKIHHIVKTKLKIPAINLI
jgi:hypothetical protein